jgi:hypothetical protein
MTGTRMRGSFLRPLTERTSSSGFDIPSLLGLTKTVLGQKYHKTQVLHPFHQL